MKLYQVIENAKTAGVWNYLVAASDWGFQKDLQFTIFSLVRDLEPSRSYGYRKRILSYLVDNKVVTGGGIPYHPTLTNMLLSALLLKWSVILPIFPLLNSVL